MSGRRIAVIGGGPVGLEAAVAAVARDFQVDLFELGQVADSVSHWGHVRMFSPFGMNVTALGLAKLKVANIELPKADAILTGGEFRDSYLLPLAATLPDGVLHEHSRVIAIGRSNAVKGDHIGEPARGSTPFRLLVSHAVEERMATADFVLDCSGTYRQPNGLGDAGIPVPAQKAAAEHISYSIPNFSYSADAQRFVNKRVLVIGAGHSAATAVIRLADGDGVTVHWLLRRDRPIPLEEIDADPLPERAGLAFAANQLVAEGRVTLHRGATIEAIAPNVRDLTVSLNSRHATAMLSVDEIVVATGFRPDLTMTRELHVQTCWATEGTYPLAASLLGVAGADCLKTPSFGAEMLRHPEPGYFALGMKSYGRSPNFLLRTGHGQISLVLDSLEDR